MFGCSTRQGKYDPLPDGVQKDSLSLGFGFTAAETELLESSGSAHMVVLIGAGVDAISSRI